MQMGRTQEGMDIWSIIAKIADIVGIVSLIISLVTLSVTRGIRKSMLAHVESSDYRKDIDEQINELDACRKLLIEGTSLNDTFYPKLIAKLDDIRIAYETILPPKVIKQINNLIKLIGGSLSDVPPPHNQKVIRKCISQLGYVIAELKKEKNIL